MKDSLSSSLFSILLFFFPYIFTSFPRLGLNTFLLRIIAELRPATPTILTATLTITIIKGNSPLVMIVFPSI